MAVEAVRWVEGVGARPEVAVRGHLEGWKLTRSLPVMIVFSSSV